MKLCLILGVSLAFACTANATPGSAHQQQVVVAAKPVSSRTSQQPQQSAPVRHLSDQELAELRRQLLQFNQQYTRRP
jgi:hypothetical protein